jgi:hypothetical protein
MGASGMSTNTNNVHAGVRYFPFLFPSSFLTQDWTPGAHWVTANSRDICPAFPHGGLAAPRDRCDERGLVFHLLRGVTSRAAFGSKLPARKRLFQQVDRTCARQSRSGLLLACKVHMAKSECMIRHRHLSIDEESSLISKRRDETARWKRALIGPPHTSPGASAH